MRVLFLCVLAMLLTGCIGKNTPSTTPSGGAIPIRLFMSDAEIAGKKFKELGSVSGESCQVDLQGPPASLSAARNDMQIRASYIPQANAVLLENCQILRGVSGCHQLAVCQGTALNVSN